MASTVSMATEPSQTTEDLAVKALNKRYEGLVSLRTKSTKGKGAWYWAHLEPILVRNPSTSLPKAVKLRCSLCDSVFSASNPSRTASEHLKRGTCPNFSSVSGLNSSICPSPISSIPSLPFHNHKRQSSQIGTPLLTPAYQVHSLAMVESSRPFGESIHSPSPVGTGSNSSLTPRHWVLSGGKDDLGALTMLENSVKKLKSPGTSPVPRLSEEQIDSALELLGDWLFESCGSVSFSSLDHPKFRALLDQLGLPPVPQAKLLGPRLDSRFQVVKSESEERIREAKFFQIASDGWKSKNSNGFGLEEGDVIRLMVNFPNGASVFHKALFAGGFVSSKYAEEVLSETIRETCGSEVQRCVGIVADKYKAKALKNLEQQNHGMVNLSCQIEGLLSLMKDFSKDLPVFRQVIENSMKVANFINVNSQIRRTFQRYKVNGQNFSGLLHIPRPNFDLSKNFSPVFAMLDDILCSAQILQMVVLDESYREASEEDDIAREVATLIQSEKFWNEVEAVYSLVKMIKEMAREIEVQRPLIGQCLPLWEELRIKVKDWCAKFGIPEEHMEKAIEKRFRKNYHPAWSAAFILDPLYLRRDSSGKYLPPFKCLTEEQEKDVDKLITRLVSKEEAHVALMELMKWRSEGLDPLYAQAVQVKQRDNLTGKMKIANPQGSRLVWETCLSEFKTLGKVAVRLIFLHATSSGYKCNLSIKKWICVHGQSRLGPERAQKMISIAAHAKLERRDFSNEEEKDAELFNMTGRDDMLNQGWVCLTVRPDRKSRSIYFVFNFEELGSMLKPLSGFKIEHTAKRSKHVFI